MPTTGVPDPSGDRRGDDAAASGRGAASRTTLAWSGDPLLGAKFAIPAAPRALVRRRRLLERLAGAADGPLTLVTGPAGAGKTTLVASWARLTEPTAPVAWLTLDAHDNVPGVFWAYALEALRRALPDLPRDIGAPACSDSVGRSLLVRLASALERLPGPVVLVLDGLEKAAGRKVAASLEFLLEHTGSRLRLVLVSRVDPLLPLHRYRAEDRLCEIRGPDLAFTPREAEVLLRRHGLAPGGEVVRRLTDRTEGWAAGLRLCALALQRSPDPDGFVRSFTASERVVADYLLAEVLDAQPPATRDLLLRTSVLDRVHPELADALTGRRDAEGILARLARANAFVEPVADGSWYRFHSLFAEVLRTHLRSRQPGLAEELHGRAARWFAGTGRTGEALVHAAAAGQWPYAAGETVRHLLVGPLLADGGGDGLAELFSHMPPDVPGAEAALVAAACRLVRGDTEGCRERLDEAGRWLRREEGRPSPEVRLTHALLRLLSEPGQGGDGEAAAAEETARELAGLMEGLLPARLEERPEIGALRHHGLARALLFAGRVDDARHASADAVAACAGGATGPLRHRALGMLALAESAAGVLGAAEDHAARSLADADRHGMLPDRRSGAADLALAAVAFERADQDTAHRHLAQARACPDTHDDPLLAAERTALLSRLELAEGRWDAALAALGEGGPASSSWPAQRLALARSAAALARGDPEAAASSVHGTGDGGPAPAVALAFAHLAAGRTGRALRLAARADRSGRLGLPDRVRVRLLRAHAALLDGDLAAAHELLAQALEAARAERLRRPFTEAGPWLRRLLDEPRQADGSGVSTSWLTERRPGGGGAPAHTEALSPRERDVLACVERMLSTDEIAAELHLSVNTVKTHLRSVYRKLCVSRRREAVERGRQLHIL